MNDNQDIKNISPDHIYSMMKNKENIILLDVRTKKENKEYHIAGSLLIPVEELSERVKELGVYKYFQIVVYCKSGIRGESAAKLLLNHDYNVVNMNGGITEWINRGKDVVRNATI